MDSDVCEVELVPRSKVGWKPNANTPSATNTPPEITAMAPGRRPSALPTAAKRAPFGSVRQALDGQNTLVPSNETTAGTRLSPAISATATATANAGPIARNMPSVDKTSAMNAIITAPAAEVMASPTRVTALTMAVFG